MLQRHPILGEISESSTNPSRVEATIIMEGRSLLVRIDPDDQTLGEAIEFAAFVTTELRKLESEAKSIAIRDLRPLYNSGWNEYDELQADGSYKAVKNPELNEDEFGSSLSLRELRITGNEGIDFWYDDSQMFWGHSVLVSAFDGTDLSNARAELFG